MRSASSAFPNLTTLVFGNPREGSAVAPSHLSPRTGGLSHLAVSRLKFVPEAHHAVLLHRGYSERRSLSRFEPRCLHARRRQHRGANAHAVLSRPPGLPCRSDPVTLHPELCGRFRFQRSATSAAGSPFFRGIHRPVTMGKAAGILTKARRNSILHRKGRRSPTRQARTARPRPWPPCVAYPRAALRASPVRWSLAAPVAWPSGFALP